MKVTPPLTVGRILHAYSNMWSGPRPAIVVNAWGSNDMANVNVFLDGANDTAVLQSCRDSGSGNTWPSVPVFAAMSPDDRAKALLNREVVCEWPPMVKQ